MKLDKEARKQTQLQWNNTPCGKVEGDENTLEYFEAVEADRFRQQYWQLSHFAFNEFKGKKVLEIGVGHGTDILQFAKGGAECYGIDITDKHLELTKRNFDLRGYDITLKYSDATSIDFPDNYFDCVYSFGVLHHIPEIEACIAEVQRVLKPGGTFYLSLYHKWSFSHLSLLLHGLLEGKLFKLDYKGLLSLIEKGADGVNIKPYVRLYSKRDVFSILKSGFNITDVSANQIFFQESDIFAFLNRARFLDHKFGWYVVATAKKKE